MSILVPTKENSHCISFLFPNGYWSLLFLVLTTCHFIFIILSFPNGFLPHLSDSPISILVNFQSLLINNNGEEQIVGEQVEVHQSILLFETPQASCSAFHRFCIRYFLLFGSTNFSPRPPGAFFCYPNFEQVLLCYHNKNVYVSWENLRVPADRIEYLSSHPPQIEVRQCMLYLTTVLVPVLINLMVYVQEDSRQFNFLLELLYVLLSQIICRPYKLLQQAPSF